MARTHIDALECNIRLMIIANVFEIGINIMLFRGGVFHHGYVVNTSPGGMLYPHICTNPYVSMCLRILHNNYPVLILL